jgi:hypothetical protein
MKDINIDNITEDDIDSIYKYLSIEFERMEDSEKLTWIKLMEIIDKEYHETEIDTDND